MTTLKLSIPANTLVPGDVIAGGTSAGKLTRVVGRFFSTASIVARRRAICPSSAPRSPRRADRSASASVVNLRLQSVMCAPLLARGEVFGAIYLGNDNVRNLFDEDPPFYNGATGDGYDAGQADPLGRVISLQLTQRW